MMKRKALGFAALAMTLLANTAAFGYGGVGDIVSIDPCDEYGFWKAVDTTPLSAGQTAYFRIRLLNVNCRMSYDTRDSSRRTSPWLPDYNGLSFGSGIMEQMWLANPPKIGVYVSGVLRGATIQYPYAVTIDDDGSWAGWYTDLVCSYTVKPGDLALPMTLANSGGQEVGGGAGATYYFNTIPATGIWRLRATERAGRSTDEEWNTDVSTNYCNFAFNGGAGDLPATYSPAHPWATDYNLKQTGLYLKTIEFAASEYSVPGRRTAAGEGSTRNVTVNIVGGSNTNGNGTVYVMTKDLTVFEIAESGMETVTISHDPAKELDGTYQVAKVTIPSGDDVNSFSFKVKGVTPGTSGTVYLSTTKEFSYGLSGDLVTNFIAAVVNCTAPENPGITVTIDDLPTRVVTANADYESTLTLRVALSEAYTSPFDVEVAPTMVSGSGTDPMGTFIGVSPSSVNGYTHTTQTVHFAAGETSKELYIYVLGGSDDTAGDGISFAPTVSDAAAAAYFNGTLNPAVLRIRKSTPEIAYPVEDQAYNGLAGGVESAFTIQIADDYADLKKPYTVQWYKTGSGTPQSFTATPNGDGEITVSVKYNSGIYTSRFRVQNSSGTWSAMRTINVQVNEAKQVSAVVEDPDDSNEYGEDAEELTIRFKLTEGYDDATLYAFLVPLDEASSNLVVCKAFTTGVAIKSGDTESTGTAKMTLLDGTDETLPLAYTIVLRTAKSWTSGETIGTYESKDLEVYISNKEPVVTEVNMSGSAPVTVNGGTFSGKASLGLNKIFSLVADDVEADLTNDVTSVWTFSDPNGNATTRTVKAPLDDIVLTNVFEVAGTYDCTVKLQDKDMGSKKYGPTFAFHVTVLNTPSVEIVFPESEVYNERAVLERKGYFYVDLSTAATKPIDVELTCTRVGADGIFVISTNHVYYRAGQMRQTVNIDDLDGTAASLSTRGGFLLNAKVVTEDVNEDGLKLKDVYIPAEEKVYVLNDNPVIVTPIETGVTNDAAINVNIPIKWKIDDVDADMTNGLTVTWTTSEGRMAEFTGPNAYEGVFTNMFTEGGAKTVTITVTDKDDGRSSVTLYYRVAASKSASVYPQGPYYGGGLSSIAKKYVQAYGRGEGRVWANSGSTLVEDFVHKYTFGFSAKEADIYAWGYRNGQTDDGSLVDSTGKTGRDVAIGHYGDSFQSGASYTSADCYTYTDMKGRDSFFYAWVIETKEEEANSFTGSVLVQPPSPAFSDRFSHHTLALPLESSGDDSRPVFPGRYLEAFFARELYVADNMGDMNADGIPDYFATIDWPMDSGEAMPICQAMTGQEISSEGEEGSATASDLADVSTYNGDLDFLPACWSFSGNPLKPAVPNWGPGEPFKAIYEIRGVGMSSDDDHLGLNEPGVSDYDLSPAETYALFADYAAAGNTLTGTRSIDYVAATNWAVSVRWTPEAIHPDTGARLNPLKIDTDGDGFDDGWEYFFWYYARIGAVTNGVWGRLEGRRFDLSAPATGTRISSEEIVEAFNPHIALVGGRDFDGDGLTDLEEYVLGTNPCDWDSDGDGMSDLYEVMNGLDPLSVFDGFHKYITIADPTNPDGDFMARCDYAEDTFTVFTFANGEMFGLPTATAPSASVKAASDTQNVYKVELADGSACWFAAKPPVIYRNGTDMMQLAADSYGYGSYTHSDGTVYLGAARTFAVGTPVTSVADAAVDMTHADVDAAGFTWRNPQTLDSESTKLALPLFNYGGDGVTLVPCSGSAEQYALAPFSGSPLVKVEEKRTVTLIHNQVFNQYGFDPRTAWNVDEYGYVDQRWRSGPAWKGDAGRATNTVAYTSRDEYLVMQYRQQMRAINDDGERSEVASLLNGGDIYLLGSAATIASQGIIGYVWNSTTYPNFPVSFVKELAQKKNEVSPFDNSTNRTITAYWNDHLIQYNIHGADTDHDGVPDGWELYVNADPNNHDDGMTLAEWAKDGDELCILEEYAGVDSCNAYTNRFNLSGDMIYPEAETITRNHPGKKSGWWNKFFPTNPYDKDTDGDGILDHAEGKGWKGSFYVGSSVYSPIDLTFIYGENDDKYAQDGSTVCFRGGGLNPCTVDTDGDLLPDAWEFQFAGVVFKDGQPTLEDTFNDVALITLTSADGRQPAVSESGYEIRGGMDGTFGFYNDNPSDGDASFDFDHDGLLNSQEYLVQSLRHLRYDDDLTPLMGLAPDTKRFIKFLPFSAWDGESFHKKCLEAGFTGLGAWQFRKLGYFTRPPHAWDMLALNKTGIESCANYDEPGYRVMLPPIANIPLIGEYSLYVNGAMQYATTDPRRWDSDEDGMDDYYELFHGLNPLLGSAADPLENGEYDWSNSRFDVIAQIHGGNVNSWFNHWTDWSLGVQPAFDALRYPWMIGTMECDADGDGLRNDEEALKVNLADPKNTHTDPTPLWMTDSSGAASFTAQYYDPDPYISAQATESALDSAPDILAFPWKELSWFWRIMAPGRVGASRNWMFAFEENEGYDTDHDFKRDATELVRGVEDVSDPLMFSDPDRRQALYLPGLVGTVGSAALSRDGEFRRAVSSEPDLLKQFTVECWVKPDGAPADAVIIERVCNYGASTLSNNTSALRANFRLGVDGAGNMYGEYEGSTVDSGTVRVTGPALAAGVWAHIAFTFDGSNAKLYLNDELTPVASASGVGLIPANGVDGIRQDFGTTALPMEGYRALPCVTVLGARLVGAGSLSLDDTASWGDFGSYFKGWVDEVRIWDGARTAVQVNADYAKRYTFDDVKALREAVYAAWNRGATRSSADGTEVLPAELLQHYNFVTLPGGVGSGNVITEPPGFSKAVLDNVRKPNGEDIDELLQAGWWSKTPVRSTVYWNYAVIPWIGNTVAHLPFMDGSAPDSQYWSRYSAGVLGARYSNVDVFDFPNTANPYPYYIFRHDRSLHYSRLINSPYLQVPDENGEWLFRRYAFQLRSDFVGTSDLVPLGGAFARRDTEFWDGDGAMDAWTETKVSAAGASDSDANGIPDWAETLGYTTAEAYLRALAEGLLPDGTTDAAYKAIADVNRDGVKDWWQKMYGLKGSAKDDADNDGLADFAEYLVSDVFKFGTIDPTKAMTNGREFDYFRRVGSLYLGELFADHDFMEDWWENLFDNDVVSAALYDPKADADADGWSNYAECRAGTLPNRSATLMLGGDEMPEYPVPMIRVKVTCENAANISAPIVVQSYSDADLTFVDATWTVPGSGTSISHERMLGMNTGKELKINLGPGAVVPGSVGVSFRDPNTVQVSAGGGELWLSPSLSTWRNGLTELMIPGDSDNAYLAKVSETVGTISYQTGDVTIDLSQLQGHVYYLSDSTYTFYKPSESNAYTRIDLSKSYMKVSWESKRIAGESLWEFALSRADSGHVREGANTFVVFADLDGNGSWSKGEPMGVVRNVDVGWSESSFEVALTSESPICPRPSLAVSGGDGSGSSGESGSVNTNSMSSHIFVYRYAVDEYNPPSAISYGPILDKEIGGRTYLHEGDFLSDVDFDIDWKEFQSAVMRNAVVWGTGFPVTSVTYRVYFQPVSIDSEAVSNTVPYISFTREFGTSHAMAVPVAPGEDSSIIYGARPTFRWTMTGNRPDTYTAFAIQVKSGSTEVWNSGTQMAPPRNDAGEYVWKAPLYPGDQTSFGKVFANTNNYTWSVTMYNSKYQSPNWSATRNFRVNVYAEDEVNGAGYYGLKAAVKYFGPGAVNTAASTVASTLRVEAYTTPDFSGEPAGRTFVRDLDSVTNAAHEVNATIVGLKPGTYYVRAFIDSDGDFKRSDWESWGYACQRGDADTGAVFAPTAVAVGEGLPTPTARVYVEDCDTDQDCLPDVWEYDGAGTDKRDFLLKKGPMSNANNGYISVNPNLEAAISDLINGGGITLRLLASAPGGVSAPLAALMLGVATVEPTIDVRTLAVQSLALNGDEVALTVGAEAEDPLAGTLFVTDGKVTVTVVVKYADSLDGEWGEKEAVKTFTVEDGAVSETFTFSLSELGLDSSKGFFKVEVR